VAAERAACLGASAYLVTSISTPSAANLNSCVITAVRRIPFLGERAQNAEKMFERCANAVK
jgi:hypothetical protein